MAELSDTELEAVIRFLRAGTGINERRAAEVLEQAAAAPTRVASTRGEPSNDPA